MLPKLTAAIAVPGLIGLAITGCGGSSPSAGQSPKSVRTEQATTATSTTTAADKESSSASSSQSPQALQIHFAFTNREGWSYSGTVPFPQRRVTFTKDVSSSPPGFARIAMDMTGEVEPPINFSDTNPGRPDGPTMTVEPRELMLIYPLAKVFQTQNNEELKEPCSVGGNSIAPTEEHPDLFGLELDCGLGWTGENASTTSPNIPEKEVDAAVSSLSHATPWYTLNFRYASQIANAQCNIFISASGAIKRSPEYAQAQCTPVTVSVSK